VRSVHLPATRTRLTPRQAYSCCSWLSSARTSTPAGSRSPSVFSSSGSSAANSKASRMRSSSARSVCSVSSLSPTITRISATWPIKCPSSPIPHVRRSAVLGRLRAGAHVKRRERRMLIHFETAFAHELKRGGEARGEHGRPLRRLDQIFDQILIERAPVERNANQPLDGLARIGERPDAALGHTHKGPRLGLPPRRVGRQQIVQRRRPLRPFDLGDRLRLAAAEHVAAKLRPIEQLLGELA